MRPSGFATAIVLSALVGAIVLGAGPRPADAHQPGTPAADAAPVTTQVLGRAPSAIAPGQALALMRVTVAPGASAAPHTHPGESIFHLASGTLRFTIHDGEAQLVRASEGMPPAATPAAEAIPIGEEFTLTAGDTIYYTATTVLSEGNDGDEDAVILLANLRGSDEPLRLAHDE